MGVQEENTRTIYADFQCPLLMSDIYVYFMMYLID